MTNWAIGQGYLGLASAERKKESLKDEFAQMKEFTAQLRQEKADAEADQLKEQAYQQEVSKFADTLLAPDRARVNQLSKIMSTKIRDQIKAHGGNLSKFLENGGHQVLSDYKSAILGSEEAATMADNKKNMESIIKAQDKGFRITPRDQANLQQYNETGGKGKITYSGIVPEIDMPDLSGYRADEEVPIEYIMHNKGNFAKITAEYMMNFPDKKDPKYEEIKSWALSQYRTMGTDKSQAMQEKQLQVNADIDMIQLGSQEKIEAAKMQQRKEEFAVSQMNAVNKASGGGSGKSSSSSDDPVQDMVEEPHYFTTDVGDMYNQIQTKGLTADKITSNYLTEVMTKNNNSLFKSVTLGPYTHTHKDFGENGDGKSFSILGQNYIPRGSVILNHKANKVLEAITGHKPGEDGKFTIQFDKTTEAFDAGGNRIDQYTDTRGVLGTIGKYASPVGWAGGFDDWFDDNKDPKKVNAKTVIMAAVQVDKNGREVMIMDPTDSKGKADPKAIKEYNDRLKGENGQYGEVKYRAFIVAESEEENPQRFYFPYDPAIDKNKAAINELEPNDLTKVVRAGKNLSNERQYVEAVVKQSEKASDAFWSQAAQDTNSMKIIESEASIFSPGTLTNSRKNFVKALYGTLAGGNHASGTYVSAVNQRVFTEMINEAEREGYKNIKADLQSNLKSNNEVNIIERMKEHDPANAGIYDSWLAQFNYLQKQ